MDTEITIKEFTYRVIIGDENIKFKHSADEISLPLRMLTKEQRIGIKLILERINKQTALQMLAEEVLTAFLDKN